ncbi:ATP-binding protein [Flavobacterium sp.]|uniref:ATP-binding protein n=1 Tax=Flavobacterium sp. TaxID=239 RepID=UPI0039E50141
MMQKNTLTTELFLEGGGLMGALIREKDWTQTPLGHPALWPQSLKTCVRIVLTSQQPMFVWWGPELINIYNDAYISIVGGKHPEALGQPASEVWKEIWHEAGARASVVMNENTGTYDEALLLLMERNGYTEETYYTFSYSPVPGDDGTTQGIICANTDDTQRIIGERQLHTLKELAKNIIDLKTNDEIYNRALEALRENPQDFPFVVLYEVSDDGKQLRLVNKIPDQMPEPMAPLSIDMEDRGMELYELKLALQTGTVQQVDHIRKRFGELPSGFWQDSPDKALLIPITQSNHEFPFAMMCVGLNPYRLPDEKYLSFFTLVADQIATALTNAYAFKQERKRAESLAEIDKAKTIFFSNISHEFRTPLTLMLGPLEEMLKNNDSYSATDKENISITHRNAMRLLRLVNSLLDFSRIESGRMQAQFQPVCLAGFTANLVSSFRSVTENAGLQLEVETHVPSPVYVDKDMWEKIVLNLMSNAFKYTHHGKIAVSLTEADGQAVLQVKDTGIGIPENEMPRLFERFHRVKNANGRSYEGTGIGLSLVKELVKLHHGTITAESALGQGTTFTVSIPVGKAHLSESEIQKETALQEAILPNVFTEEAQIMLKSKTKRSADQENRKPKILVVDDNADMQEYIGKLLEKDYRVSMASNGKEALQSIAASAPDLVLSDVMMPVMDGIEMLKILKNDPQTKRIPVLLLSARAGEESRIEGYDLGADDYLVKPFSAKELFARVQSQIRLSKSRNHIDTQLHSLFQQAPIAICIFRGSEFIVEMANAKMLELWGKSASQVMNKPVFEGMPDAQAQGYEQLLETVFTTGQTFSAQEQSIELVRNGVPEKIFVKFVFEPLHDEDGSISGIMALADEITEQVEVRRRIEVSETRQKLAIEAAEMGHFEWDIVQSEFIFSDRLAHMFGYEPDENPKHPDFKERIHPDDRQLRLEAHQKALETGVLFYEARVIWRDGSEHWIRFNGKVIYDGNHEPAKMYGTTLDITEHKIQSQILEEKVEQRTRVLQVRNRELRESEERYQRMTDEVQDYVIIMLDKDGTILNWNKGAQKIKGYNEQEILGKNFRIFYRQEDLDSKLPDRLLQEAVDTGRAMNEGYRVRKDGTTFWGSVAITALHDKDNNIIGFSKVTRDLTERKMAEDKMQKYNSELEFQNKELEQFAYVASHDLQEPLRKIQMFTGLLEQNINNEEAAQKYLSKMNLTAERMSELIKAVLNYSRLSRSDQQVEVVDLSAILENVLVDFELLIEEKQAVVRYEPLPVVEAIPLQINQLFSNLIGNSLKFAESAPKITITSRILSLAQIPFESNLSPDNQYLEMVFSDEGIGFEQKYLGKIFTIFQRLNDRMSYSGTGIGLALCKKIIENHSGFITAQSEQGKGASFFIYLPYPKKY